MSTVIHPAPSALAGKSGPMDWHDLNALQTPDALLVQSYLQMHFNGEIGGVLARTGKNGFPEYVALVPLKFSRKNFNRAEISGDSLEHEPASEIMKQIPIPADKLPEDLRKNAAFLHNLHQAGIPTQWAHRTNDAYIVVVPATYSRKNFDQLGVDSRNLRREEFGEEVHVIELPVVIADAAKITSFTPAPQTRSQTIAPAARPPAAERIAVYLNIHPQTGAYELSARASSRDAAIASENALKRFGLLTFRIKPRESYFVVISTPPLHGRQVPTPVQPAQANASRYASRGRGHDPK